MRRNTIFCGTVHLKCTNLNLKRLSARSNYCRMQRLIHIRFWHRNVVLETSRNRFIFFMHDTKCCITVLDRIHDDTNGKQIINLVNRLVLIDHLLVNREKVFCSTGNICLDPGFLNLLTYLINQFLHISFSDILAQGYLLYQIIIGFRFKIFQ